MSDFFTRAGRRMDSIFAATPQVGGSATEPVRPLGNAADGWANALGGMGFGATDKSYSTYFSGPRVLTELEVCNLYRGDGLASRIVDLPAHEALRQGYEVIFEDDVEHDVQGWASDVEIGDDEFGLDVALERWLAWGRLFGGAAIYVGTDAKDKASPLELGESLVGLRVLSRHEMTPADSTLDRREPVLWELGARDGREAFVVHRSRLILLGRSKLPSRCRQHDGWNDPLYTRVWRALAANGTLDRTSESILHQFVTPIQKIRGLSNMLAGNGPSALAARLGLQQVLRSMYRVVALDTENEDYELRTTSVAGLAEFMDKFPERVASVVPMPISLLMGRAPGGLNATGEADIRFWYDGIRAREQGRILAPALRRVLTIAMHAPNGPTGGDVPERWRVEFRPLWQMSEAEAEDIALKRAQRDNIYLTHQVLDPDEVAVARFDGDLGDVRLTRARP